MAVWLCAPAEPEAKAHVEYYEGRTDGWKWIDGSNRWWEKFVVWDNGFNGLGQCVCRRLWRWNGSSYTVRTDHDVRLSIAELNAIARAETP